jgi:hypothetical protein
MQLRKGKLRGSNTEKEKWGGTELPRRETRVQLCQEPEMTNIDVSSNENLSKI